MAEVKNENVVANLLPIVPLNGKAAGDVNTVIDDINEINKKIDKEDEVLKISDNTQDMQPMLISEMNDEDLLSFSKVLTKYTEGVVDEDENLIDDAIIEMTSRSDWNDFNHIFTESLTEEVEDIFYNQDKYENGEINLLCIIGYSGGGKSTISNDEKKVGREVVDMDKIVLHMSKDDEYFKKLGPFYEEFIKGPGAKYRVETEEQETIQNGDIMGYRKKVSEDLWSFAKSYASAHKATKLVIEGVWIYRYIDPAEANDCAVYIKGTSLKESTRRAINRDTENMQKSGNKVVDALKKAAYKAGKAITVSADVITSSLEKWRKYYLPKYIQQLEKGKGKKFLTSAGSAIKNTAHDVASGKALHDIKVVGHSFADSTSTKVHKLKKKAKKVKKKMFKESMMDFINDENDITLETVVEENFKDTLIESFMNNKIKKIVFKIGILKNKIAKLNKKENVKKEKLLELKRKVVELEKEKRDLIKDLPSEQKKEAQELQKKYEKMIEDDFDKVMEELESEVKECTNFDLEFLNERKALLQETIQVLSERVEKGSSELSVELENCENLLKDLNEIIIEKVEEPKKLPPEFKRLDELRGKIENLTDKLKEAQEDFQKTGERVYENKIKGLEAKIDGLQKELKSAEEKANKIEKEIKESVILEAAKMEEEIKPVVDKLNELGYKVKYASPGHKDLRKKEDVDSDGVYYDKLYSDARVMFDTVYPFKDAPKYWHFRTVDDCSYLDITPIRYDEKDGTPDEAFEKWKKNYMESLKNFVDSLNKKETDEEEVEEMTIESIIEDTYFKFDLDEE